MIIIINCSLAVNPCCLSSLQQLLFLPYLLSAPFLSFIILVSAFLEYVHTVQYASLCREQLPHD